MLRWKAQVRGTFAPESLPPIELIDHFPEFLGEITAALRKDAGLSSPSPSPDESRTSAGHGVQRFAKRIKRRGSDIAINDANRAERQAEERGMAPTARLLRVIRSLRLVGRMCH
jgi:hypothetical protein